MNKIITADAFASMWRKSRNDAGKSQEYMSKALGVSKKTVQNWEDGFSSPSQVKGFEWFHVLGVNPLPYYLEIIYPAFSKLTAQSSDEEIEEHLITLIKTLPSDTKRKLLFALHGKHGSSPTGIIELLTAHLHTPLRSRLNIASNVLDNYKIALALNEVVCKDNIMPNLETLQECLNYGKDAVINQKKGYTKL